MLLFLGGLALTLWGLNKVSALETLTVEVPVALLATYLLLFLFLAWICLLLLGRIFSLDFVSWCGAICLLVALWILAVAEGL